ncbi:MAG: hypothetical protein HXY45_00965 [Syntrophaceae bacterium]|nr:hypothetical protein [Syntrophaceae bacterium]
MEILRCFLLIFLLTAACGCAGSGTASRQKIDPIYQEKIRDWQKRIQREGWSESRVNSVLAEARGLVTYRMEIRDHWDTPRAFRGNGYSGDCEDIVVFMMGTLRRLEYPHNIRVLVVRSLFEDHALLRVEMPGGFWKAFDVASSPIRPVDPARLAPIVEFDETTVVWHSLKGSSVGKQ